MQKALKGAPPAELPMPDGIARVNIDADSGLRDDASPLGEYFYAEFPPRSREQSFAPAAAGTPHRDIRDQLF
jgi:membrane carboxypeptidase/penicillin-binding protein